MSERIEAHRHPDGGWTIEAHRLHVTVDAREDGGVTIEIAPRDEKLTVTLAEPQSES